MEQLKKLVLQFFKFGAVGGICFLVDSGLLTLMKEKLGFSVLLAAGISFSISVILNYRLSMHFVFKGGKHSKSIEFITYVILSAIGLLINEIIMYIGTDILLIHYLLVKVAAAAIVLVFNFITRKIFIEKQNNN